jgi:hypothetical protein
VADTGAQPTATALVLINDNHASPFLPVSWPACSI